MSFSISLFKPNAGADQTRQVDFTNKYETFRELALAISTDRPWSPGIFQNGIRNNANLDQISLLVLDFDAGMALAEALIAFKDYKHIIGTSKSHGIEKGGVVADRFRVALAIDKPVINDSEFKAVWFAAFAKWPAADRACKDAARFFFPCKNIVSVNENGLLWSERAFTKQLITPSKQPLEGNIRKGKLSKATKDFLIDGAPDGEWHGRFFKAAMDFKEQGYDIDTARLKLAAVSGELDATDEQQLSDVYENRPSKYGPRGAEQVDELRSLILRSKFIVNLADPTECLLLEPATGVTLRIHPLVLAKAIGNRNDQVLYQQQSVINAIFDYDRFGSGPLYLDRATGAFVYNQYLPPKWQHAEFFLGAPATKQLSDSLPDIYDQFFNHLVDGDLASKEYLIDWLATAIQARNYTLLTALGEPGVGKGVLGEIMRGLFGDDNFRRVRDEVFKTKFNGQIANKALIYVDEVALRTEEDHNRLKDIVNEQVEVERKGKDAVSLRNQASFYISANKLDAIKLEAGDRRFSIIQLTDKKLALTPLMAKVAELTLESNIAALAAFLRGRTVARDMLFPFISARSSDVKEAGLSEWENFVIFEWTSTRVGQTFDLRQLQKDIEGRFTRFNSAPGRRKIEDLARKYPECLKVSRKGLDGNIRLVQVVSAPLPPIEVKRPYLPIVKTQTDH